MLKEIWRDITGYDGIYQVSNLGNVRSIEHIDCRKRNRIAGRVLKPGKKQNGYLQVVLKDETGKSKNYYVHRLVMKAFVGECPAEYEVNHIDENKSNNTLENLEYVTHRCNINHGTGKFRSAAKKGKPVEQYSTDDEWLAEYASTSEAERITGVWHNNISKACKRKVKTAGGYIWKYKEGK